MRLRNLLWVLLSEVLVLAAIALASVLLAPDRASVGNPNPAGERPPTGLLYQVRGPA